MKFLMQGLEIDTDTVKNENELGDILAYLTMNYYPEMGAIGVGLGRWTGAGTQNSKAMVSNINAGKSWGSKAFLTSAMSLGGAITERRRGNTCLAPNPLWFTK